MICALVCSVLYRLGGIGNPFKTWMRDWVIPTLIYTTIGFLSVPMPLLAYFMLFLAILPTGFALTTYWDDLFKGVDNFYMHGFMVGLGAFPLFWAGYAWWTILVRAIILGVLMGTLNTWINKTKIPFKDWIEELFRGAVIILTLPLLLL